MNESDPWTRLAALEKAMREVWMRSNARKVLLAMEQGRNVLQRIRLWEEGEVREPYDSG